MKRPTVQDFLSAHMGKIYNNRLPKWQLYEQWQDPLLAMVDIGGVVVDVLWLKNISVQQQTQKGKPKITLGGKEKKKRDLLL